MAFLLTISDKEKRSKLESIYMHYHKDLFVTAYSILKDHQEAEDVVQRMFLKLHNLNRLSDIKCQKTRAYLVTIVRNLSYDASNRKKGILFMPIEEKNNQGIDDEITFDEYITNKDNSKEMAVYLNDLHRPYADMIMLKFYHDLSIVEIANILTISENNVRVRINRAIKALKNIVKGRGGFREKFKS